MLGVGLMLVLMVMGWCNLVKTRGYGRVPVCCSLWTARLDSAPFPGSCLCHLITASSWLEGKLGAFGERNTSAGQTAQRLSAFCSSPGPPTIAF